MFARAARRVAILLPGTCRLHQIDRVDSAATGFTCPYCGRTFGTTTGRDRHVNLDLGCRPRHDYATSGQSTRKRQRTDEDTPYGNPPEPEPPTKRVCIEEESPPVAGPSHIPVGVTPVRRRGYPTNGGMMECNGLCIEEFPINTAGAPIGTKLVGEDDLRGEYLQSCGRLGDRGLFRTAEILMTTGLTGIGRSIHLQGPIVSVQANCRYAVLTENSIRKRGRRRKGQCGGTIGS